MKLAIEHYAEKASKDNNYLFDRETFANNLKNIFLNTDGGFVLAIDASWGEGKTTFIHRLIHDLKKHKQLIPIYYDAFANDFSSDTFLSIGATISYSVNNHFEKLGENQKRKKQIQHLKSVTKRTAIELVKLGTNLGLRTITTGLIQNADLQKIAASAFNSATFGTLELDLNEKFKAYENAKSNIQDYIKALESVSGHDEKVVFFIDELDRCRPNFAVEVLEKVKHLFAAKNVIFVISYNKNQLAKIISNVYGVDQEDSMKYLEKFVHIEANLPISDNYKSDKSYEVLFDSFMSEFNIASNYPQDKLTNLKELFVSLCSEGHFRINLREIERSFSYVSFCFAALPEEQGIELFEYFLPAAMIKVKNRKLFESLKNGDFNSYSGDNDERWVYEFFKKHYSHSLINKATNIYHVEEFRKACNIVSVFKLPAESE